jgi:gliding motility-associated lipoprotein GldH
MNPSKTSRNNNGKAIRLIALLAVALTLVGCNRKTIWSHYEHTPLEGWEKNDTLSFSIPYIAQTGIYKERVGLRIGSTYPFMGLTLIAEQQVFPLGAIHSDTLSFHLVEHDGTVLGYGIGYYQYSIPLRTLQLNKGDSLQINIRHYMRREILPGVSDVGIILERETDSGQTAEALP